MIENKKNDFVRTHHIMYCMVSCIGYCVFGMGGNWSGYENKKKSVSYKWFQITIYIHHFLQHKKKQTKPYIDPPNITLCEGIA